MSRVNPSLSAYRDARILELKAQGQTDRAIAEVLGLERSAVTKRLGRLGKAAAAKREELKEQRFVEHLAQYEYVIGESLDGWRASKQPLRRRVSQRTRPPATEDRAADTEATTLEQRTVVVEERTGDASFLTTALAALGRREKLLGLGGPIKIAPTTPDGASPYRALSDDELKRRLVALLTDLYGDTIPSEILDQL